MIAMLTTYAMAAVLVAAIVIEMKSGRIPNWLTLIPPALFVVWVFVAPDWSTVLWQLGSNALGALIVFVVVLLFGGVLVIQMRRWFGSEDSTWNIMSKPVMPMSLPIGFAGLAAFFFL